MDIKRTDHKRRKTKSQVLYGGVILAALIAGGVAVSSLEPAPPKVKREGLTTGHVHRGEFVRSVYARGTLVPTGHRLISAASDGSVEEVRVKPGAQVDNDTVIVELSNPGLTQQAQEAGWAAEAAEAELQSLKAELERTVLEAEGVVAQLRSDLEGVQLQASAEKELAAKGVIPMITARQTQLRTEQLGTRLRLEEERQMRLKDSIQAQLVAQQARVEQAKRLYERRLEQVKELHIKANVNDDETQKGSADVAATPSVYVVQEVFVEQGQQLVLGAKVARVARQDKLIAELAVSESQAGEIHIGQKVLLDICRNDADPACKVPGKVIRIDPAVREGKVWVDVEPTAQLPAGARSDLSIEGDIEIESIADALYVEKPKGKAGDVVSLFRVDRNGKEAFRVPVTFGRSSRDFVEVLVSGKEGELQEGDEVILREDDTWRTDQQLRLH